MRIFGCEMESGENCMVKQIKENKMAVPVAFSRIEKCLQNFD
jgi:hypothetical protein